MHKFILAFVFVSMAAGCVPKQHGVIDATGYSSTEYSLGIKNARSGGVLSNQWRIDNLWERGGKLVPKTGDDYQTQFSFDIDGDGESDTTRKELLYEVRYEHLRNSGVIWLRTLPIAINDANKDLGVLMKDYIDDAAYAGYEVVAIGTHQNIVVERRYAGKVLNEATTAVGQSPAYEATLDVANLDRIKVEPSAIEKRIKLMIVRPGFIREISDTRGKRYRIPVLLLVGYANNPKDFEQSIPEFNDFLARITINGRAGYQPTGIPVAAQ